MSSRSASLSTHVIDSAAGGSRAGVRVELQDLTGSLRAEGVSDGRGRIENLAEDLVPGTYRLTWLTGGELLTSVSVTVRLIEGKHHHLPIVVSGFSAAVYLGG